MRPDAKHQRSQKQEVTRARTLLKTHLAWLRGFPAGQAGATIRWCSLTSESPFFATILIDREMLRRAVFALNKITANEAEYRSVMPDLDGWLPQAKRLVECLKQAVHQGTALPEMPPEEYSRNAARARQARANLLRQYPALQAIGDAMMWATCFDSRASSSVLAWLAKHAQSIDGMLHNPHVPPAHVVPWVYWLWQFAHAHGDEMIQRLLRYLSDPTVISLPHVRTEYLVWAKKWVDYLWAVDPQLPPQPIPEPLTRTIGADVAQLVTWLLQQPTDQHAELVKIVDSFLDDHLADDCLALAKKMTSAVAQARRWAARPESDHRHRNHREACIARFHPSVFDRFPTFSLHELLELLKSLFTNAHPELLSELIRLLPLLPVRHEHFRVRENLILEVAKRSQYSNIGGMIVGLRALRLYLNGPNLERRLQPWLESRSHQFSIAFALGNTKPQRREAFYNALGMLTAQGSLTETELDNLDSIAENVLEPSDTLSRFLELQTAGLTTSDLRWNQLECAELLYQAGADYICSIRLLMNAGYEVYEAVKRSVQALMSVGQSDIVAYFVRQQRLNELVKLGQKLSTLMHLQPTKKECILPRIHAANTWWECYPVELYPELQRLAERTSKAQAIAARILRKEFPAITSIQEEIVGIEQRLALRPDNQPMQRRLANLRQRLAKPKPVSAVRLANLRQRLELAGVQAWLAHWLEHLQALLRQQFHIRTRCDSLPAWCWEPRNVTILGALMRLRPSFRELGLRLLQRRCGPPPWHFHNEPANQAFIAQLSARGIHLQPWLEPTSEEWLTDSHGERYRVAIEVDPFEVLRMGEPFDTCLSPHNSNFFSAMANAVDANKRVIYVRNTRQQIVARCLLALTDLGGLLTFHVYSNLGDVEVKPVIGRLVQQLATQMGTVVVRHGRVPTLVAPDWYDDGAIDICGRFPFLDEGSSFRRSLAELPLEELLPTLRKLFDPLPLNEMLLTLVIDLREFEQRPSLILPLLALFDELPPLVQNVSWRVAWLAQRAERADYAAKILNHQSLPAVVKAIRRHNICSCCSYPALNVLAAVQPSVALRALRATRDFGVRTDEDERNEHRRYFFIKCYEQLGRSKIAEKLRSYYRQ